jgi:CBS domain-containing protein
MICPRCGHDNVPGDDVCSACLLDLAPLDQPVPKDRVQSGLVETPVRALDPRPPVTVPADAPLRDAVRRMLDEGVGTVLVLDGERLAGIFSERDLLQRVPDAEAAAGEVPLARYMTPDPETVRPDDSLALALHKMDVGGYRHLPVVEGGRPVGMISVRDMIRHITRLCRE